MKIDSQVLATMQLFGRVTRAELKGFFQDELTKQMVFVVQPGHMRKAIGKGGANVKKLENLFKTKVRLVEFSSDRDEFLVRLLAPLKVKNVEERDDGTILVEAADHKTRGYIIGRAASALRNLETNLRRFFEVKEIKVV